MNLGLTLQTKQVMSQAQVQSLNILAMSMTELQDFLQKEEIENPLVECADAKQDEPLSVMDREYANGIGSHFADYSGSVTGEDSRTHTGEYFASINNSESVWDMVYAQLPWNHLGEWERRIVEFCVDSLDRSGYLTISNAEIAEKLQLEEYFVEQVVSVLKMLQPKGIFASNLKECLLLQIRGMEREELLERLICEHLDHMAEGRISAITRGMKISSTEARRLIQTIKSLNPRPLNGYGPEQAQYVIPDVILKYETGEWSIGLNDTWTGSFGINDFYVQMMQKTEDEELRAYFEEKLRRARFIMSAVEQRRQTVLAISQQILKHQEQYLLGHGDLRPMTMEQIAEECRIHKSTVSRAIKEKYLLVPRGCMPMRDLFTSGIGRAEYPKGREHVSRNVVKARIREFIVSEDRSKPYSDEQLVVLLRENKIDVSRRTVAKYRSELGIRGAFQRREI